MREEEGNSNKEAYRMLDNSASSVRFHIRDDPFIVPFKFKRELPINKNIFQLAQPDPKNYNQREEFMETDVTMLDPLQMSITINKFLLLEKIISYSSLFSIALSIYSVHYIHDQTLLDSLNLFHTAITLELVICTIVSTYFKFENNKSRRSGQKNLYFWTVVKCLSILVAPNKWWGTDEMLLHLALLIRIIFPFAYYIRASLYYSPRAARIIHLYGIKPEFTFQFATKVILNSTGVIQVLIIYVGVVLFYSHCLYLARATQLPFIDCFQIIIVTLPTIGFGDYRVTGAFPRIIILMVLLSGVALNAFVTLTLLKKFQMSTNESNSYQLMEKLNMVEKIEELSSEFIIRKFRRGNQNGSLSRLAEKEKDETFKEHYKECKARYRKINSQDSAYQFTFFKDALHNLKIKIHQGDNMVNVLLARLTTHRQQNKAYLKQLPKQ